MAKTRSDLQILHDSVEVFIKDTKFSIVYDQRESDGFETLRLYEQTFYKNNPTKPHKYPVEVSYIFKSLYDDGWEVTDEAEEHSSIGIPPYMYKINGFLCGNIGDGLSLFLEPLTKAGLKIPGVSTSTEPSATKVSVEVLKSSTEKTAKTLAVSTFITIGVIMSLIGIAFPPLLVCGIVFIVVGVLSSRAKTKVRMY